MLGVAEGLTAGSKNPPRTWRGKKHSPLLKAAFSHRFCALPPPKKAQASRGKPGAVARGGGQEPVPGEGMWKRAEEPLGAGMRSLASDALSSPDSPVPSQAPSRERRSAPGRSYGAFLLGLLS